ncbi:hypothetical protein ACFFRR_002498 [Megaselia abdita]
MKTFLLVALFVGIASCVRLQKSDNPDLIEGDMMLTPRQKEMFYSKDVARNGMINEWYRWPNGIVYYKFDRAVPTSLRQLILRSLGKIEAATCLRFRQGANSQGHHIRVTNIRDSGCWSYVGYIHQIQDLNLGYGCEWESTVIHEFLHAVGFQHQQCSYERDNYVEVHLENVEKDQRHNFDKYTRQEVTNYGTRYDYDSIMHYDAYAFSMNGKPTMVAKIMPAGAKMGEAEKMSPTDIFKINSMYKCRRA